MLSNLLEYHPWSRQKPIRESFLLVSEQGGKMAGLLAVVGVLVGAITLSQAVPDSASLFRPVALLGVSILGFGICVCIGFIVPFYRFLTPFAKNLQPGSLLVVENPSPLSTACTVDSVFIHHGAPGEEVQVGLTDGSSRSFSLESKTFIAQPHDFFSRWRTPRPDARSEVTPPGDAAQLVAGWLWDMQLELRGDVVPMDGLIDRISTSMREEFGLLLTASWLQDGIDEGVDLRLFRKEDRGAGKNRRTYVALTDTGCVAVAALARKEDTEVYKDSGESRTIMNIINWGNFINKSPGAAANIGSGSAAGSSEADVTAALQQIVSLRLDLAREAKDQKTEEELLAAIEDLQRELEHPEPSERRLKRFANAILGIAGGALSSLLGDGAWAALKPWLGV